MALNYQTAFGLIYSALVALLIIGIMVTIPAPQTCP